MTIDTSLTTSGTTESPDETEEALTNVLEDGDSEGAATTGARSAGSQLLKKIFLRGTIVAKTGLFIGGSNMGYEIGGASMPVARDPLTGAPYIPGSSLKGKMRALTELSYGAFDEMKEGKDPIRHGPYHGDTRLLKWLYGGQKGEKPQTSRQDYPFIRQVYGFMVPKDQSLKGPGRLLVRDGLMTEASRQELREASHTDMPYTVLKPEVALDRITATPNLRHVERVPAGAEFELNLTLNILTGDLSEEELLKYVLFGLYLVQDDALGGHSSRGYGQVEIRLDGNGIQQMTREDYLNGRPHQPYAVPESLQPLLKVFTRAEAEPA